MKLRDCSTFTVIKRWSDFDLHMCPYLPTWISGNSNSSPLIPLISFSSTEIMPHFYCGVGNSALPLPLELILLFLHTLDLISHSQLDIYSSNTLTTRLHRTTPLPVPYNVILKWVIPVKANNLCTLLDSTLLYPDTEIYWTPDYGHLQKQNNTTILGITPKIIILNPIYTWYS